MLFKDVFLGFHGHIDHGNRFMSYPGREGNLFYELQRRLSKEAEVAYNTIVKIESGENPNPTVDTLERIAKALGVSIEKLFKE